MLNSNNDVVRHLTHLRKSLSDYDDSGSAFNHVGISLRSDGVNDVNMKNLDEYNDFTSTEPDASLFDAKKYPDPDVNVDNYLQDHTTSFIELKLRGLINNIISELDIWILSGTSNSLPSIARIKSYLDDYKTYLVRKSDSRLLLTAIELLFINNNWEDVETRKLIFLRKSLVSFKEGEITDSRLKRFIIEMKQSKLSLT